MVMADGGDRDRATFARRKFRPKERDYDSEFPSGGMRNDRGHLESSYSGTIAGVIKIPKILTKSSTLNQDGKSSSSATSGESMGMSSQNIASQMNHIDRGYKTERGGRGGYEATPGGSGLSTVGGMKPVSLLRKDNGGGANHVMKGGRGPGTEANVSGSQQQQLLQGRNAVVPPDKTRAQVQLPPTTSRSVKLVDESLSWLDAPFELMMDQSNFLVIGCLGTQGVGKSTVMSHLSTNTRNLSSKIFAFRDEKREARDKYAYRTTGIDMCVTQERTILLDTQALLSTSIQDNMAYSENKYSSEFSIGDNSIELQSMQVATFLMTVCHVIIVVANDMSDVNFVRFLRLAEMLKPTTPSQKNPMAMYEEYYPYVVFVQNKCNSQDFKEVSIQRLDVMLQLSMQDSKLLYRGMPDIRSGSSSVTRKQSAGRKGARTTAVDTVNLCLLPVKSSATDGNNTLPSSCGRQGNTAQMTGYRGSPGFEENISVLRRQLMSMPRRNLAHTTLSEKNWFHYAARTWDVVRKQQQLSEYARLLS